MGWGQSLGEMGWGQSLGEMGVGSPLGIQGAGGSPLGRWSQVLWVPERILLALQCLAVLFSLSQPDSHTGACLSSSLGLG